MVLLALALANAENTSAAQPRSLLYRKKGCSSRQENERDSSIDPHDPSPADRFSAPGREKSHGSCPKNILKVPRPCIFFHPCSPYGIHGIPNKSKYTSDRRSKLGCSVSSSGAMGYQLMNVRRGESRTWLKRLSFACSDGFKNYHVKIFGRQPVVMTTCCNMVLAPSVASSSSLRAVKRPVSRV